MVRLPEAAVKLIEGKNFAHLATLMPDGSPQLSAVWIDHEGDIILVNTAEGRVKEKNPRLRSIPLLRRVLSRFHRAPFYR